jgi:hypothetical protein
LAAALERQPKEPKKKKAFFFFFLSFKGLGGHAPEMIKIIVHSILV